MKVLLLSPPYLPEYMRNARCDFVSISHTQWYPIWLGYCGCLLEKHNHEVRIIDAPAYGLSHEETKKEIIEYSPELLVVYSSTKSEDNDIDFTERIIDVLGCKTVFVGPYVSIHPAEIVEKSEKINLAVKGEFDYPILELASGIQYDKIRNLVFKENNCIHSNDLRPLLDTKQLDELPFVTDFFRRHLNLKYYKSLSEYFPFIDLMTGRGCCWGLCTFCLWVHSFVPGQVYNKRSISNVIEELKFVTNGMKNVRSVMIQDDTLPSERAVELSEAILKANLKITWSCYARPNMDYDVLRVMKRAGCRNLHVGYESANPSVLKNIKKGITLNRMTKFTQDAKKARLRIHADFAIGFNGETAQGIKKTIKWAKELNPDTAQFQLIIPYPSTPFYDYLHEKNYLLDGEPNYPELSREQIRKWAKNATREFYLSWRYLKRVLRSPHEHFFGRLGSIARALPAMFWKRWGMYRG